MEPIDGAILPPPPSQPSTSNVPAVVPSSLTALPSSPSSPSSSSASATAAAAVAAHQTPSSSVASQPPPALSAATAVSPSPAPSSSSSSSSSSSQPPSERVFADTITPRPYDNLAESDVVTGQQHDARQGDDYHHHHQVDDPPLLERPLNSRIFLGNLASERTSKSELRRIFEPYGRIIEDPVVRRSFGFIQYDNTQSAQRAIAAEQGRMIGGMRLGSYSIP